MKPRYLIPSLFATALLFAATSANAFMPRYVFFFLGDGMANAQIQVTEAYLTTINGGKATLAADLLKPENRLNMTKMPIQGMQTTYDAYALMTDSASAGTAFASGIKTRSAVINMDGDGGGICYKSIAQLAHESGKKVGVITSVSLDHATPAAYYASVPNRGFYNNIATQLAETGYEFFGGGGFIAPTGPARSGDISVNISELLKERGYTVLNDRESILALKTNPMDKVVAINPVLTGDAAAMPYEIDRPDSNLSLKEMTEVAIASLMGDPRRGRGKGFFLMVEGGKIDWAAHANDAVALINDMLDFDAAVKVALDFASRHRDTLIVVTGDHETGGMSVGHATTAYTAYYDRLLAQTNSYEHFAANQWAKHKEKYKGMCESDGWKAEDNLVSNKEMPGLMESAFGLKWDDLNDYQREKLEEAYDSSMCELVDSKNPTAKQKLLYGGYEPIVVTITHVLNERASIGWTSYAHTGVPVPVYAQGWQADQFAGFYDNTDIAKRLAKVMRLRNLPLIKDCPAQSQ